MPIGQVHDPRDAPEAPSPGSLEEREVAVLSELARESDAHVAFTGLRRRLGLHQQALTRTLARLSRQGLVSRGPDGYRLTDSGYGALAGQQTGGGLRETMTVIQALLPPQAGTDAVAQTLGHRWFRGLRWFGITPGPGETTLTWMREADGSLVRIRLQGGALTLETELPPDGLDKALPALRPVIGAIAELYGIAPTRPSLPEGASALTAHLAADRAAAM